MPDHTTEKTALDGLIRPSDRILITGANGFIGLKVLENLLQRGLRNVRCFIRSSRNADQLQKIAAAFKADLHFYHGNLLSQADCSKATKDVTLIYHLAVGPGGKSFPNAFMNTVIPTRNLLTAGCAHNTLKRFVNVSSFAVYSNQHKPRLRWMDESCPLDEHPERRGDAYAYAKLHQDRLVADYCRRSQVEYVIVRPGAVYGPGKKSITGRVGIDTFGIFMHLGGSNQVPFTYVDNCAEAIVLAGLVPGIDQEIFNIVDDDLPTSRRFLTLYKKRVHPVRSIYFPHALSYFLCFLWEKYAQLSEGQLPPVFSRAEWHAYWKKTRYSNEKIKKKLGWTMKVSTAEGLDRYLTSCRNGD